MADPVSTNIGMILMSTGTASGTWGALLNADMISVADAALGSTVSVALSSTDLTLTSTQRQNLGYNLTGTLSANVNLILPLSQNATTQGVGGFFVIDNNTTGSYGITVKTAQTGSTGVVVPQGVRSILYSNGTAVAFADDAQNRVIGVSGSPSGQLAGTAASATTRASRAIDYTTNISYLCTASGTAGSAGWSVDFPVTLTPQGYLTASSDATNPILTADSIGATTIYYTAYVGAFVPVYNGVSFAPVPITSGQMSLALSSSAQASSGIYDVIFFLDSTGVARIGFSPAWTSAAAGSCSRGSGAGTPQLTRINGILVNAQAQTVNNGATTYSVAANKGTYLGSVFIDSAAGQVTCHRSYGQSRKFGVWNAYNRVPIIMKAGDSTTSWTTVNSSYHPSNSNAANAVTSFQGLAEEVIDVVYTQNAGGTTGQVGIGRNTTGSITGYAGANQFSSTQGFVEGRYEDLSFTLGITSYICLERSQSGSTLVLLGTEAGMVLSVSYAG